MALSSAERSARYRSKDVDAYRRRKAEYARTQQQREKRTAYMREYRRRNGALPIADHLARFMMKVNQADGCWLWTGARNLDGYGLYRRGIAHRWAYRRFVGEIPEGLEIDHLCRVRHCVNPNHLEAVPHIVNIQRGDLTGNGRHMAQVQKAKTHCPQNHAYAPENLVKSDWARGIRRCRICSALKSQRYYVKKRKSA